MVLCVPCRCQCRALLDVFERLRHLVRSTQMPKEVQEDLLRRIKSAEIFVMSLFQREVKNQSSTAGRCIRHALSTMSNTAFSCPCNHGTLPGKTPPLTMLAVVKELAEQDSGAFSKAELSALEKGQAPERLWNSVCESCDGPGKLLLCNSCNLAWHPHCEARTTTGGRTPRAALASFAPRASWTSTRQNTTHLIALYKNRSALVSGRDSKSNDCVILLGIGGCRGGGELGAGGT